jgi:hypothetical protein
MTSQVEQSDTQAQERNSQEQTSPTHDQDQKRILNLSIPLPLVRRVSGAWIQPVETDREPAPNHTPNHKEI